MTEQTHGNRFAWYLVPSGCSINTNFSFRLQELGLSCSLVGSPPPSSVPGTYCMRNYYSQVTHEETGSERSRDLPKIIWVRGRARM